MAEPSGSDSSRTREWPPDPYKGLTFYGPKDAPLFAGRASDVKRVASLLGKGSARVLLLHGPTGCGKSSFLRAGLMPFLEKDLGLFRFAKDPNLGLDSVLLITSTQAPLLQLAGRLYQARQTGGLFARQPSRQDDDDVITLDAKEARAFLQRVQRRPRVLVDELEEVTRPAAPVLLLVVDQAEEMLTLDEGPTGDVARRKFFQFLGYLTHLDLNLRLIISFRSEYHGRFYALMREGGVDASRVEDYYLDELDEEQMIEAILKPTSTKVIDGLGSPRDHYKFMYEEPREPPPSEGKTEPGGEAPEEGEATKHGKSVPERIAEDLADSDLSGGALPVLQIVCRQLYQQARERVGEDEMAVIRGKDYTKVGRIEGQIDLHLQRALYACIETEQWRQLYLGPQLESVTWRDVLANLVRAQAGGNVTTELVDGETLRQEARDRGSRADFDATIEALGDEAWRVVRPERLTDAKGTTIVAYRLGHDVLGSVLLRWSEGRERARRRARKRLVGGGVAAIALGWFVPTAFFGDWRALGTVPFGIGLATGLIYLLISAIPEAGWFKRLYHLVYRFLLDYRAVLRLPS